MNVREVDRKKLVDQWGRKAKQRKTLLRATALLQFGGRRALTAPASWRLLGFICMRSLCVPWLLLLCLLLQPQRVAVADRRGDRTLKQPLPPARAGAA